ncbi:MAG: tRNA (uridine(34)/cytosine(34)/5-carboxymethylaminomethyluridine(34)-2'-O)-methyltransferase TrmL, partial [Thermoclostridium sp.]|nr:tRNA (uridine(34)/cytosine(34)/5-carboxymethylaminomethyluridine(34)-2'-O)-methyltransferase TrmL [Thermoclostridium sp.]
ECFFIFGKETKGLPEELLLENYHACIRIPMRPDIRSLKLSNSVAVITYEFFRQKDFGDFQLQGFLKRP